MGGGNPIRSIVKDVTNAAADIATAPTREIARAAGLNGVVDGLEQYKKGVSGVATGVVDLATDEKGKKQKAADAEQSRLDAEQATVQGQETKRQGDAAYAASESARMGAGSKSRTLLTGPAGLEDEDGKTTVSRKTLKAR